MAGLYLVGAWLLIQVASTMLPAFDGPLWALRGLIIVLALGFVPMLIFSWVFELTPQGLKRDEDVRPEESIAPQTARRMNHTIIAVLVLALGYFAIDKFVLTPQRQQQSGASSDQLRTAAAIPDKQGLAGARPSIQEKSIAVLPFDNLSRDPDNAYFCEGVQDEILTRLAKVADLKVISRTSTQRFKSAPSDLREIAKQLGVMHIVEGSVQKANDQVRVNVQLINAMNDAHLWAETYDRKLIDIFSVESEIAKTIADTLQAKLTGSEKKMMAAQPTNNTEAYELYHKGKSLWEKRSGDNIPKAIAYYEQAIARDPNYALAYAGLAKAYILLPFYTGADRLIASSKAKEAALKALRLDSNLAEAHGALGKVLFSEIDLAGAMREYKRAIELNPNDATAHHWFGNDTLAALGRFEEAISEGKRAIELDPLSTVINVDLGVTFYYAHRYDEADTQMRKSLEIDPTSFYAHYNLGIVLQLKGDLSGAIAEYEKAKQLGDNPLASTLCAQAKAQVGDKEAALRMLSELDKMSQHREVVGYLRTLLYLSLNKKDAALHWLEQDFPQ